MRALTLAIFLLATPALADVAGVAKIIDGDSLEVAGEEGRASFDIIRKAVKAAKE